MINIKSEINSDSKFEIFILFLKVSFIVAMLINL